MKKIWKHSFVRFCLVGGINTIIGTSVMFVAYNVFGMGYWISSALNYISGSIFSYFANKYFTFGKKEKSKAEVPKFVGTICVCYLLAYGIAKPTTRLVLVRFFECNLTISSIEQISMLVGMVLFVGINYLGQRIFVFNRKTNEKILY